MSPCKHLVDCMQCALVAGVVLGTAAGAQHGGATCGEWSAVAAPDPAPDSMLLGVAAVAADDAWAVGWVGNNTLAMHWDGASWSIVPTPNPGYSVNSRDLVAVAALASDDVWAAGSAEMNVPPYGFVSDVILIVHWNGSEWQLAVPPGWPDGWGGSFVHTIEAIAPDDIWFGGEGPGGGGNGALALHWNGTSFELIPTETFDAGCGGTFGCGHAITDMAAIAPDDIWAVGRGADGDASMVSQIWHWDGAAWKHTPGPAPGIWHELKAVAAFAPDDAWALGGVFDVPQGVILHWDGTLWSEVPAPVDNFEGIIPLAPDDIWSHWGHAVHYDGVAWSLAPEADPPAGIAAGAAIGPCDAWMVGFDFGSGMYFIDPYIQRLQPAGLWTELGGGVGGVAGVPVLQGKGELAPGGTVSLSLRNAAARAAGAHVIGLSTVDLPAFGGTLVPALDFVLPLITDSSGAHATQVFVPPTFPGATQVWIQAWILDPTAPALVAGSNTITHSSP